MLSVPGFSIAVQYEDFDVAAEYRSVCEDAGNAGAVVMFSGLVRELTTGQGHKTAGDGSQGQGLSQLQGDGDGSQTLTLEHYPGMTQKALGSIVEQARQRWPLLAGRVIHRIGELRPADQIVLVLVASAHRDAAFAAAEFIMDYLKTSAPFWKQQRTGEQTHWVDSRQADAERAARWQKT